MKMKTGMLLLVAGAMLARELRSQDRVRTPINIPDVPGYVTLKCDFHIHTAFSDGLVWPNIRAEEAWRDGLDAIAITDHLEYQPHKDDLPIKHNRSFEIARSHGDTLNLMVIRGSEITRQMPPGHFNAIFLKDSEPLATPEWRDSINAAVVQGGFVFWNHPGWTGQQADGIARWYAEHDELLAKGALHGIEVVNGDSYYPEAHKWCLEKKLTMLGNSDVHSPINLDYGTALGERRPLTLVFATNRSPAAVKDALVNRRTAVWFGNQVVGEQHFLLPLFQQSIKIHNPRLAIKGTGRVYAQVHNNSDIRYQLRRRGDLGDVVVPDALKLAPQRTTLVELRGRATAEPGRKTLSLPYTVENLLVQPNRGLDVTLAVDVEISK